MINRAVVRDGKPYPPESLDELEVLAGVPDALRKLRERRLPPDRRHESARRRARHADARGGRGDARASHDRAAGRRRRDLLPRRRRRLRLPQAEAGRAARRRATARPRARSLVHGRRPLARHRSGQRAGCRCLFVDHGYAEQQPAGSFVRVAVARRRRGLDPREPVDDDGSKI